MCYVKGEWFLFFDDDSWYFVDFFKMLCWFIEIELVDIYLGWLFNKDGKEIMVFFVVEDVLILWVNIWYVLIEWVIVFCVEIYWKVGGFDEDFGVGFGMLWNFGEG